jgi:hypothetical protein
MYFFQILSITRVTRGCRTDEKTHIGKNPASGKRKQVYKGKFHTKKAADLA